MSAVAAVKRLVERVRRLYPVRAWQRYSDTRGDLLAAGIGYFAFFSTFPALALLFTVAGFVLRGRPELIDTIASGVNASLPNFVRTADNPTGVIELAPPTAGALTLTGAIAFATMLWAGLGWIGSLASGLRAIFAVPTGPQFVTAKLRDLAVLVVLGVAIAGSALLSGTVGGMAQSVAAWLGLPGGQLFVTLVGLTLGAAVDVVVMIVLLRLLAGRPLSVRDVRGGALVGGVALTLVKYGGGFLVGQATKSPLLGSVAVVVGMLFWLNLMSRITLFAAAWVAIGLPDSGMPADVPGMPVAPVGASGGPRAGSDPAGRRAGKGPGPGCPA